MSLDPQSIQAREIREKASASLDDRRPRRDPAAFWSFRRYGGLAAAAAVVMLIFAIWSWIYFPGSRSTPPAQSNEPVSAPSPPSTTAATGPGPATPPPVSSVPGDKPATAAQPGAATDEGTSQQRVAQLRQDAREQFQRGQRAALNTVMTGLTIAPEDAELRSILDSILTDAHRITGRSNAAATTAGAAKYIKTYHEALKLEQDAAQQVTAGRKDAAIRILWRAEETFDRAERDANLQLAEIKRQDELAKQQRLARANAGPPNPSTGNSNAAAPAAARPESPASKAPPQVQPRAPEPVPTAPGSQPSASDLEKARVAGIVHRYAAGYSALNAAAVSVVSPGEAVWQFSEFDFYTLKVDDLATELSPDGLSATVVCTATHTFKRKRAPAPVTERVRQTFSLRKRGAGWIIASIGYDRTGR